MLHCIVAYHVDIDAVATPAYTPEAGQGQEPDEYLEVAVADQAQDQETANLSQDQGKPWCITPNLNYAMFIYIYVRALSSLGVV